MHFCCGNGILHDMIMFSLSCNACKILYHIWWYELFILPCCLCCCCCVFRPSPSPSTLLCSSNPWRQISSQTSPPSSTKTMSSMFSVTYRSALHVGTMNCALGGGGGGEWCAIRGREEKGGGVSVQHVIPCCTISLCPKVQLLSTGTKRLHLNYFQLYPISVHSI